MSSPKNKQAQSPSDQQRPVVEPRNPTAETLPADSMWDDLLREDDHPGDTPISPPMLLDDDEDPVSVPPRPDERKSALDRSGRTRGSYVSQASPTHVLEPQTTEAAPWPEPSGGTAPWPPQSGGWPAQAPPGPFGPPPGAPPHAGYGLPPPGAPPYGGYGPPPGSGAYGVPGPHGPHVPHGAPPHGGWPPAQGGWPARMPTGEGTRAPGYYPKEPTDGGSSPTGGSGILDKLEQRAKESQPVSRSVAAANARANAAKGRKRDGSGLVIALSSIVLLVVAAAVAWVVVVHEGDTEAALADFSARTGLRLGPAAEEPGLEASPSVVEEAPGAAAPATTETKFKTAPDGCKVYEGDTLLGTTPFTASLGEGPHVLRFDPDKGRDVFRVVEGDVAAVALDLGEAVKKTELFIEGIGYREAQVRIDGDPVGNAPVVFEVEPGMHAVQLLPRGSAPLREDIYARKSAMTTVTFRR